MLEYLFAVSDRRRARLNGGRHLYVFFVAVLNRPRLRRIELRFQSARRQVQHTTHPATSQARRFTGRMNDESRRRDRDASTQDRSGRARVIARAYLSIRRSDGLNGYVFHVFGRERRREILTRKTRQARRSALDEIPGRLKRAPVIRLFRRPVDKLIHFSDFSGAATDSTRAHLSSRVRNHRSRPRSERPRFRGERRIVYAGRLRDESTRATRESFVINR